MTTVHAAMQALLAAANLSHPDMAKRPPKPVIAISRDHGALGREIAEALAKRLDMQVYDKTILAKVADRLGADHALVQMLDESIAKARDMWLVRLFTGVDISQDAYRDHLVNVVMGLARSGGILLGRGANVILATSCALRVRITASPEVCARRVEAKYGISHGEAVDRIHAVNHARGKFVWEMFHKRNSEAHNFDLVINTDRLTEIEPVVDTILAAYKAIEAAKLAEAEHAGA